MLHKPRCCGGIWNGGTLMEVRLPYEAWLSSIEEMLGRALKELEPIHALRSRLRLSSIAPFAVLGRVMCPMGINPVAATRFDRSCILRHRQKERDRELERSYDTDKNEDSGEPADARVAVHPFQLSNVVHEGAVLPQGHQGFISKIRSHQTK